MRVIVAVLAAGAVSALAWVGVAAGQAPAPTSAPALKTPEPYPMPEWYAKGALTPQYRADAEAFLAARLDSPYAPRVATDLMMLGTLTNDETLRDRMRGLLLIDYGGSFAGTYALSHLKDASEVSKVLRDLADRNSVEPRPGFAGRFVAAIGRAGERHGLSTVIFDDNAVALLTAAYAGESGQPELADKILTELRKVRGGDAELMRVVQIVFDPNLSPGERFIALDTFDAGPALSLQKYVRSRLTQADQASPPVRKVMAATELARGRFAEALALIDAHPARDADAQLLFWRLWCHAATGDREKADAANRALQAKAPKDPWAAAGAELAAASAGMEANVPAFADALTRMLATLRARTGQLQLDLTVSPEAGSADAPVAFYVSFADCKSFEMHFRVGKDTMIAYRATPADATMFLSNDGVTTRFAQGGPVPVPKLTASRGADKAFSFGFNFAFVKSFEAAAPGFQSLFAIKDVERREDVVDALQSFVKWGHFPAKAEAGPDGRQTLTWVRADARSPDLSRVAVDLAPDGTVTGIRGSRLTVRRLDYGAVGSFELKPPAWPAAPTVEKMELDPGAMFRMMGTAVQIFTKTTDRLRPPIS